MSRVRIGVVVLLILIACVALVSELMILIDPNVKNADDGDPFGPRPYTQRHVAYVSVALISSVLAFSLIKK